MYPIKFDWWVGQAKLWFLHHFHKIYGSQERFIHFLQKKQRNCLGWKLLEAGLSMKQKLSLRQIFVTFHFMEMRFHFFAVADYPVAVGSVCYPDSSNCHFALLATSDALTSGHGSLCNNGAPFGCSGNLTKRLTWRCGLLVWVAYLGMSHGLSAELQYA